VPRAQDEKVDLITQLSEHVAWHADPDFEVGRHADAGYVGEIALKCRDELLVGDRVTFEHDLFRSQFAGHSVIDRTLSLSDDPPLTGRSRADKRRFGRGGSGGGVGIGGDIRLTAESLPDDQVKRHHAFCAISDHLCFARGSRISGDAESPSAARRSSHERDSRAPRLVTHSEG
jgi:hypothetical protein